MNFGYPKRNRVRLLIIAFVFFVSNAGPAWADFEAGVAAYQAGDYAAALAEFRKLADKGVVVAQTNLGYMYSLGEGVEQDLAESAKWFRRAAEAGSTAAQVTMGALAYHGEGMERNAVEAYAWFSIAAAGGQDSAEDYLTLLTARMARPDLIEAKKLSESFYEKYSVHRTVSLADP